MNVDNIFKTKKLLKLDELYLESEGLPEPLKKGQGRELNIGHRSFVYTCMLNEHIFIYERTRPSGRFRKPSPRIKDRADS